MKTSPLLTLSVTMSLAVMSAGCITVNGVDVGGVNAKADVKANTNISGNTVKNGMDGDSELEPTPSPKTTLVPSAKPEPSAVPTSSSSVAPGSGAVVSAETKAIAEDLSILAAGELHAEYYSFMADDAAESEGNIIANDGLGYATLYLTGKLSGEVQAKRAEWKTRLRSLAQGAYEARVTEREALFRAFRTAAWTDNGDGTERKKVTFETVAMMEGRSPISRHVEMERIRNQESKMAVLDNVVFTQTIEGRPVKTTRVKELKADGSEVITFSASGALIASNGGAYRTASLGQVTSLRWTTTVAAGSVITGTGVIVLAEREIPLKWTGSAFNQVGVAELANQQWIRLSLAMGGAPKGEGWGLIPPGAQ